MSQTRIVSRQNKFVKLVHLVGFITKKFVTMHGHMNLKSFVISYYTVQISGLFFPIFSFQSIK